MKIQDILYFPKLYTCLSASLGNSTGNQRLLNDYVRASPGDKILDIGCGPATIIDKFQSIKSNYYNDCLKLPYTIFVTRAQK